MNSNPSATTRISPFMGTNGYKPQMTFDLQLDPIPLAPKDIKDKKERQRAEQFAIAIEKRSEYL